jgi:tRNA(Ile)-lysidine synthase
LPHALQVKYREGGESLKLKGRPQKKLKQLLQESGMPPWKRQRVPLLFADAELVCVPGVGIAESYLAQSGQNARQVVWAAPTQLLTSKP